MEYSVTCLKKNIFFYNGNQRRGHKRTKLYIISMIFLFVGLANSSECTEMMHNFQELCKLLGVPIAPEKTSI